jgi:hypothetical protein
MAPSSVDVCFFDGNTGTFNIKNVTLASLALTDYTGTTGVSIGTGRITADPLNASASQRTAYATQAATDYYKWLLSLTDATLRGIVNLEFSGMEDCVEWVHDPNMLVTRIIRPHWADRNIYGELGPNYPNPNWTGGGSGSGSGSGSGEGCSDPVVPVSFKCKSGARVATVTSIGVKVNSQGHIVAAGCDVNDTQIGPCSPINPDGTKTPVVIKACPVLGHTKTVITDYTFFYSDDIIIASQSGITLTLPNISSGHGGGADQFWVIAAIGSGMVTISGGAASINGAPTLVLGPMDGGIIFNDGVNNWYLI